MGLNVKSLLSAISKKYGVVIDVPLILESFISGFKNPVCLFTVGSGWKNFGKYKTGTL